MTDTPETQDGPTRVMLIAAHPDDPEFGCGGTMAKWAAEGKEITYVILTNGDKGSHDPQMRPGDLAEIREKEQWAAARAIGVKNVIFGGVPDQMLEPTLAMRRYVIQLIREHKPHVLVAIDPWRPYQLHPDHRAAGYLALDALYGAREVQVFPEHFRAEAGVDIWRIKEIYLFWTNNVDYVEDISDYIEARIEATRQHVSQVRRPEQLAERLRQRTAEFGKEHGFAHAEGFKKISLG